MKPFIAERLTNGQLQQLTHPRISPPPMDHALATDCLLKVKEIFDRRGLTFWLIFGTLLGAVRDSDFIKWDKDIDLACYESDAEARYPAILELEQAGMKVIRTGATDNSFQVKKELVCIDFGSAEKFRGNMWRYGRFYERKDFFSELIDWPFLGTVFKIPKNYEEYLQQHYHGEAWKTPDPTCKHAALFKIPKRYQ